ncbi:MAG: glycosyltransferase family 4 protein [Thermoleophilia bacterium]|nr:glycosyltransferase family 4 protein [Thermoleophilia bacterium]
MAERPLRVLGVGDGRSLVFLRWAWRLAERGHEIHFVSDRITTRPGELDGITPHRLTSLTLGTRVKGFRRLRFPAAIRALAKELDVDLVHAHYLLPYGYWAARADVHPLVMSPWNTDIFTYGREQRRGRRRVRAAIAAGDRYVVSSTENAEETARLGADPEKVERVVWYVDLRPFGPEKRVPGFGARFGWPADSILVLSLRNYRPNTNLDVLLRAFARARREVPQARLILAARGGWTRAETERLVDELGLRDSVAFHFAAPDELPELCASADIGVSIASTDATPASMVESMASRLPMLMGEAVTIDEWITQGEGGEVVPPRDEDAVSRALLTLLCDPELRARYGERNERVVRERLSEHPGALLERVYEKVLAR